MAQQKSLSCLDINSLYSCEKKIVKSLVVLKIQAFKICCTAAVQRLEDKPNQQLKLFRIKHPKMELKSIPFVVASTLWLERQHLNSCSNR